MNFECENCHFKLTNEFCPKCGQRMDVACDVCPAKDRQIHEGATRFGELYAKREHDLAASEAKRIAEVTQLREGYEKTIDDQWRELERYHAKETKWNQEERQIAKASERAESEAWQKVADTLDVKLTTGYRIDEARVLQRLRVERSAAALLRAEVADLKRQLAGNVDEFARQREEFLEHLQNKNGAARLEASTNEV